MKQKIHPLRNFLDKTYLSAAYLAAFFLVCILVIICVQMIARWTGFVVMGATAYAGYAMAASAFFAMAYTLHQDGHIRVRILLNKLGKNKNIGTAIKPEKEVALPIEETSFMIKFCGSSKY